MNDSVRKSTRDRTKSRPYWLGIHGVDDEPAGDVPVVETPKTPHQRQITAKGMTKPLKRRMNSTKSTKSTVAFRDITNTGANCVHTKSRSRSSATDAIERRGSQKKYKKTANWGNERDAEILPGHYAEDAFRKPIQTPFAFAIGHRRGKQVMQARKRLAAERMLQGLTHASQLDDGPPHTPLLDDLPPHTPLLNDGPPHTPLLDPVVMQSNLPEHVHSPLEDTPSPSLDVLPVETPVQRQIEKGKWGGWRPGLGRPRKFLESGTPIRRRYKPGEPRPPRGRRSKLDPNDITPVIKRIRYKPGEPRPKRGRPKKQTCES